MIPCSWMLIPLMKETSNAQDRDTCLPRRVRIDVPSRTCSHRRPLLRWNHLGPLRRKPRYRANRELALSRALKGPVIGVSYSQSEIIAYHPESKIDVRAVDIEDSLPGGWIVNRGVTQLPIGTLPQPGWTTTYAIIGGTGKFADARGVKRLTLIADGITFTAVITPVKQPGRPRSPSGRRDRDGPEYPCLIGHRGDGLRPRRSAARRDRP